MTQKQSGQFQAGITGRSYDRCLKFGRHQASISWVRAAKRVAAFLSGQTIKIVSSPATLPTASGHCSSSSAAATGWALPTVVLITSRFCARRTSTTNSRTSRETGGKGRTGGMIPLRQGVSLGRLDQAEIANVAGERRLPYLDAAFVQAALQVFLARDRSLLEQCQDGLLSQQFAHEYLFT